MFDIFYLGDNPELVKSIPFARQIDDLGEVKPKTKMFWLIEPNVEIVDYDILEYRPPAHDQGYEHIWKCNEDSYGGVKLLPRSDKTGIKEINLVVCKKNIEVIRQKKPGQYFVNNPTATHVWCVDPDYKINEDINWVPNDFEPNYIHSFHLRGQLEHLYPEKEGGVKLYPREWQTVDTKYHNCLDSAEKYPVLFVSDVDDYGIRDLYTDDFVWLIDQEHKVEHSSIDWTPNPFEQHFVHNFRMPYQLTDKYPEQMGGISLVPKDWKSAEIKIHRDCPVEDENYDVFYVPYGNHTQEVFADIASKSDTEWFWVVDEEFKYINGKFLYIPENHEQDFIHVFKIPDHLEERYSPIVSDDDFHCGVYLVSKHFIELEIEFGRQKLHKDTMPIKYDVFHVSAEDINSFEKYARRSRTKAFWLIDEDYELGEHFKWLPKEYDQGYINIFKIPGQLQHKYPSAVHNVADNRCGGVKLVPVDYSDHERKYQGYLKKVSFIEYEQFNDEATGRAETKHDWFWVIDNTVTIVDYFKFEYYPESWDSGKTHVWQKLNPKTHLHYDYAGVKLCPKVPNDTGRPKYITDPASIQNEYPIYYLNSEDPYLYQLEVLDNKTENTMYYVVDPHTELDPGFDFDYYPTQWDEMNVHIFRCGDNHTGVRLYPKGTFGTGHEHTEHDLFFNRFENLKLLEIQASLPPTWPIEHLEEMNRRELIGILNRHHANNVAYVWTVDNDVEVLDNVVNEGILPSSNKVLLWQRTNPRTDTIHSYGGLRLWPTDMMTSEITTESVILNKLKNKQYVRKPGSVYKPYDVVFISYKEPDAEKRFAQLKKIMPGAHWVKDVEGIFEAHKAAAELATSKMFWVVDADAELTENFTFSFMPDVYDQAVVHVWHSLNPVTGAEYGYGGVKLFNREQVRNATSWGLDFTTGLSSRFKVIPEVSCVSRFNTDAYSTWRSAFREAVKLSLKEDSESQNRLEAWLHPVPDAAFRHDAKAGAEAGKSYAIANKENAHALDKINDYAWLKEYYESQ